MTSVYFPAHVVLLIKRLVNVVSTLSISHHYITQERGTPDTSHNGVKELGGRLPRHPSERWKDSQWKDASSAFSGNQASGSILKASIGFPNFLPGNWSWPNLSFFQPQLDGPQPDDDRPPPNYSTSKRSSGTQPGNTPPPPKKPTDYSFPDPPRLPDTLHQLLANPALYDPVRTPRYPIVLCHGLYGFDSRGPSTFPSMRMHYWSNVLKILRGKVGADVIVTSVPGTGSITTRASKLHEQLCLSAHGRGVNFLAHSMGGLDCRHLISHIRPKQYAPLSLTSIATPHRGSPFMDWCTTNIGIGKLRQHEKELKEELQRASERHLHLSSSEYDDDDYFAASSPFSSQDFRKASTSNPDPKSKPDSSSESSLSLSLTSLPSSFTTLILGIVDSPAYANLTSHYLNKIFNPATPDDPNVKYWSVAGRLSAEGVNIWHPFWLPKMVLDGAEESEREKLKTVWDQEYSSSLEGGESGKTWTDADGIPLWANQREWGNDGLVTVQSAKWGEFLGIMEGCDHWEMRGARGIEFGVDLPAIPVIGLGSSPAKTSVDPRDSESQARGQAGDGWGFGDWTRFVTVWKQKKDDAVAAAATKKEGEEAVLSSSEPVASASTSSTQEMAADSTAGSSLASPLASTSATPTAPTATETRQEKRAREQAADDAVVKSSTDKLSVVFDWLIERVPDPKSITIPIPAILGAGGGGGVGEKGKGKADVLEDEARKTVGDDKSKVKQDAVLLATYHVGVGSSSSPTPSSSSSPQTPSETKHSSEMKQRMEKEDKGRRKNELATKQDLERFYMGLARRMYDAGL